MSELELNGFVLEAQKNPTDFKLIFACEEDRVFVELIAPSDDPGGAFSDNEPDPLFYGDSEFEIFTVAGYNSHLATRDDIIIEDINRQTLGILCLSCSHTGFIVNEMTTPRYIAYVKDCSNLEVVNVDKNHTFKKSYLFIKKELADEYRDSHMDKSALWGGFTHDENRDSYRSSQTQSLVAGSSIKLPTFEHQQKLNSAILSDNGFDRFLKKYQLLELLFDYICVARLRTIESSLKDFRGVMSKYSREDIDNLRSLLTEYIDDISPLLPSLYEAEGYQTLVENIFQTYSKDSNPLKDSSNWNKFWIRLDTGDLEYRENDTSKFLKYGSEEEYRIVILKIVAYWIYRIRCSIAHNKIGEFLFENSHENFVIEIGEKLLDQIIESVFSNSRLLALLEASKAVDDAISTTIPR